MKVRTGVARLVVIFLTFRDNRRFDHCTHDKSFKYTLKSIMFIAFYL